MLLRPLDLLWDGFQNRGINICACVGDIAIHATGSAASVAATIAAASHQLVEHLEGGMYMIVSRDAAW